MASVKTESGALSALPPPIGEDARILDSNRALEPQAHGRASFACASQRALLPV